MANKHRKLGELGLPKYTYAEVSHFHRTVLSILDYQRLKKLHLRDLTTILKFSIIINHLLNDPFEFKISTEEEFLELCQSTDSWRNNIRGRGVVGRSKKGLNELILWMQEVITIRNLTLDILLDEYYTKFPYALKPPVIPKSDPLNSNLVKNKNKSSGKP